MRQLGRPFWGVVIVGLFTLARSSSEAFLLLRGTTVGLELRWIPMLIVIMNVVYALTSYPAGRLSDRIGRYGLLALIVADVLLALADGLVYLGAGVALWGLHMGSVQPPYSGPVPVWQPPPPWVLPRCAHDDRASFPLLPVE